jgi:hypothetical protein
MNTLKINRKTHNKNKDVTLTLVLIGALIGSTVSANIHAAPVTGIENKLTNFVNAKSQQIFTKLNAKLQQSIDQEISALSINFSLNNVDSWIAAEQQVKKAKANTVKMSIK